MKITKVIVSSLLISSSILHAGWMDTLKEGFNTITEDTSMDKEAKTATSEEKTTDTSLFTDLSSTDMNGALKVALNKGVKYATDSLGKENGYLNNSLVKIGLPSSMEKTATLVRKMGGDQYVDDLILAMNNAASEAAPKTAVIFSKSITDMSITDAKNILSGSDGAATEYFKKTNTKDLQATIAPIIQKSMENNDVAKYYDTFQSFYKKNAGMLKNEYVSGAANALGYGALVPSDKDENINAFITNKSIDGLMLMIKEQEKKIRDNPLAQNNELIKKVFSVFE